MVWNTNVSKLNLSIYVNIGICWNGVERKKNLGKVSIVMCQGYVFLFQKQDEIIYNEILLIKINLMYCTVYSYKVIKLTNMFLQNNISWKYHILDFVLIPAWLQYFLTSLIHYFMIVVTYFKTGYGYCQITYILIFSPPKYVRVMNSFAMNPVCFEWS